MYGTLRLSGSGPSLHTAGLDAQKTIRLKTNDGQIKPTGLYGTNTAGAINAQINTTSLPVYTYYARQLHDCTCVPA